jgi:glutamine amidotransferase
MGWNRIRPTNGGHACPLLKQFTTNPYMYFVHSYYARPDDERTVLASTEYGVEFPAMVGRGNVFAVQFHPEKSQREGIRILKAFGDLVEESR